MKCKRISKPLTSAPQMPCKPNFVTSLSLADSSLTCRRTRQSMILASGQNRLVLSGTSVAPVNLAIYPLYPRHLKMGPQIRNAMILLGVLGLPTSMTVPQSIIKYPRKAITVLVSLPLIYHTWSHSSELSGKARCR